ncbi:uncharacterized protein MYCGRDRAFT_109777, partial [Zymoseptoria tritici IPO323]
SNNSNLNDQHSLPIRLTSNTTLLQHDSLPTRLTSNSISNHQLPAHPTSSSKHAVLRSPRNPGHDQLRVRDPSPNRSESFAGGRVPRPSRPVQGRNSGETGGIDEAEPELGVEGRDSHLVQAGQLLGLPRLATLQRLRFRQRHLLQSERSLLRQPVCLWNLLSEGDKGQHFNAVNTISRCGHC